MAVSGRGRRQLSRRPPPASHLPANAPAHHRWHRMRPGDATRIEDRRLDAGRPRPFAHRHAPTALSPWHHHHHRRHTPASGPPPNSAGRRPARPHPGRRCLRVRPDGVWDRPGPWTEPMTLGHRAGLGSGLRPGPRAGVLTARPCTLIPAPAPRQRSGGTGQARASGLTTFPAARGFSKSHSDLCALHGAAFGLDSP
jgi:hypothetical protein